MAYLKNYIDKIIERGNIGLAESISNTAEDVGNNYLKNFSFTSHEIGLLFGNVQSGKNRTDVWYYEQGYRPWFPCICPSHY